MATIRMSKRSTRTFAIRLALLSSCVHRIEATTAWVRALAQDMVLSHEADAAKSCKGIPNAKEITNIRLWGDEQNPFLMEMSSYPDPARAEIQAFNWRVVVGMGGEITSLQISNQYKEKLDVLYKSKVRTAEGNPEGTSVMTRDSHETLTQDGSAILQDDVLQAQAVSVDCTQDSCYIVSWGQPAIEQSDLKSPAMFVTRYANCNGVLEVTTLVHRMVSPRDMDDAFVVVNTSPFEINQSILPYSLTPTMNGTIRGDERSFRTDQPISLDSTSGYTVFSNVNVPQASGDMFPQREQNRLAQSVDDVAEEDFPGRNMLQFPCADNNGDPVECSTLGDDSIYTRRVRLMIASDMRNPCRVVQYLSDSDSKQVCIECTLEQQAIKADFGDPTVSFLIIRTPSGNIRLNVNGVHKWAEDGNKFLFFVDKSSDLSFINSSLRAVNGEGSRVIRAFAQAQIRRLADSRTPDRRKLATIERSIAIVYGITTPPEARDVSTLLIGREVWPLPTSSLRTTLDAEGNPIQMSVRHYTLIRSGESFIDRYYLLTNDNIEGSIHDEAQSLAPLIDTARQRNGHYGQGQGVVLYQYRATDGVFGACLDTESCSQETAELQCRGSTVPQPGFLAWFSILCGSEYYAGPDLYHFSAPLNETQGVLNPYPCHLLEGDSVRPHVQFLGFFPTFDDGPCSEASFAHLAFDPVLCTNIPANLEQMRASAVPLADMMETQNEASEPGTMNDNFKASDTVKTAYPNMTYVDGMPETSGGEEVPDVVSLNPNNPFAGPSGMNSFVEMVTSITSSLFFPCDRDAQAPTLSLNTLYDLSQLDLGSIQVPFVEAGDITKNAPAAFLQKGKDGVMYRIRPIYMNGLPYRNKCTKVYAWLSLPVVTDPANITVVPGVVAVHGGGGTAFRDWCEDWAKEGFASIAFAHEGQTDVVAGSINQERGGTGWQTSLWPGPFRNPVSYGDTYSPLTEQWMYHAVADSILAARLLHSFPEVGKVGITGVSWGGVIAATVVGFDKHSIPSQRLFSFGIMGYGCGSMRDSLGFMGWHIREVSNTAVYDNIWDSVLRISDITIPTMWLSFPQEYNFPIKDQSDTYRAILGAPAMPVLIPGLGHSHKLAWRRPENYEFARSALRSAMGQTSDGLKVWAEQESQGKNVDNVAGERKYQVVVRVRSGYSFASAYLISTQDTLNVPAGSRQWTVSSADAVFLNKLSCDSNGVCGWRGSVTFPIQVTSWFINFYTPEGLCFSSYYNENV